MSVDFDELKSGEENRIKVMSALASAIVKEYYDPLLGAQQNDYMIEKFQSAGSIANQLSEGKKYFFIRNKAENVGFVCFYPRGNVLYLSKLYLRVDMRGKGFAREIMAFLKSEAEKLGLCAIELNVNKNNQTKYIYEKLGFEQVRAEKIDIGSGYYMDDYVYRLSF